MKTDKAIAKSSSSAAGPKLRKKAFRPRSGIDNNAAVGSVQCRVEVKRRGTVTNVQPVLYAFPSFDRSDSLLFLPSTMARLINSSDSAGLSRLLQTYLDKSCQVSLHCLSDQKYNLNTLLEFYSNLNDLDPDAISCVHSTKVVDNEIRATIYMKYTAVRSIYTQIASTSTNPLVLTMIEQQREACTQRKIDTRKITPQEQHALLDFYTHVDDADTNAGVLVYSQMEMVLHVNDVTKKVIGFGMNATPTSFHPVAL